MAASISAREQFAEFPERVRHSTRLPTVHYDRVPGCFAAHGRIPEHLHERVRECIEGGAVAVCRGAPGPEPVDDDTDITPVYRLESDERSLVPTGLVHVVFRTALGAHERVEPLSRLGFEVVEIPSYATNTAWIRARSGQKAPALTHLEALEQVPDIENVEPEMLG